MSPIANPLLETCQLVAKLGGAELMKHRQSFLTREKAPNDLVTNADLASQRVIHDALFETFPDHGFLGEENIDLPMTRNVDSPFRWIVDPLDGTLNYVHGLQSFSVSVALQKGDQLVAAAVFDPWLKEMYSADDHSPATLNGDPIHVGDCQNLPEALGVISLPGKIGPESPELADFLKLLYQARSIRRLGSAALNLCYVAAGRVDFYWATTVKCWDVAAGYLILQQAGGCMTDVSGAGLNLDKPRFVAANNESLNQSIRQTLHDDLRQPTDPASETSRQPPEGK